MFPPLETMLVEGKRAKLYFWPRSAIQQSSEWKYRCHKSQRPLYIVTAWNTSVIETRPAYVAAFVFVSSSLLGRNKNAFYRFTLLGFIPQPSTLNQRSTFALGKVAVSSLHGGYLSRDLVHESRRARNDPPFCASLYVNQSRRKTFSAINDEVYDGD